MEPRFDGGLSRSSHFFKGGIFRKIGCAVFDNSVSLFAEFSGT